MCVCAVLYCRSLVQISCQLKECAAGFVGWYWLRGCRSEQLLGFTCQAYTQGWKRRQGKKVCWHSGQGWLRWWGRCCAAWWYTAAIHCCTSRIIMIRFIYITCTYTYNILIPSYTVRNTWKRLQMSWSQSHVSVTCRARNLHGCVA